MSAALSAPGLAGRFALLLNGLAAAVAARMAKPPPPLSVRDRGRWPLLMLVWTRLRRAAVRLEALVARAAAGPVPRRPARPSRPRDIRPRTYLPRSFGWLIRLMPEGNGYGSQLHYLLAGPEIAALLDTAPQAARILRPLCRMLAIPPPPARAASLPVDPAPGEPAPPSPPSSPACVSLDPSGQPPPQPQVAEGQTAVGNFSPTPA